MQRPLLIALLLAGLLVVGSWTALRRAPPAGIFASVAFLLLVLHSVPALVMSGVGAWWVAISLRRRLRGEGWRPLTTSAMPVRIAAGYSTVLLIIALWSAGSAVLPRLESRIDLPAPTSRPVAAADIYVLMLDGYPRIDTLAQQFDLDNTTFESELTDLGFVTAGRAQANYTKTWLSTAALLNAEYVHEIPEIADPPDGLAAQARLAEELINEGAVLERLRLHGYEIVSIPSPIRTIGMTDDVSIRQPSGLNSLEMALVTSSLPSRLFAHQALDLLAADARGYIQTQLELLAAAAEPQEHPRFVWAHLMSPHPPFLLAQEPEYLDDCFPGCSLWQSTVHETGLTEATYAARMRVQVQELNRLVVAALADIVDRNPDATVIVMSDHGARHYLGSVEEHFRVLFAARAGSLDVAFPDDISHVNIFRRILATGFDVPLADLPYQAWASDWLVPFSLTRHR